jgi:diadenosine tetraphosphate (Ap4A) HIT family hydrolase
MLGDIVTAPRGSEPLCRKLPGWCEMRPEEEQSQCGVPVNLDASPGCEFCRQSGGEVLWRDEKCRVVLVADPDYHGFCRVIWNAHVKEMTDLARDEQQHCMRVVLSVEQVLRRVLKPHKINLASFGNMTPHLHWHVIPRFEYDAHFPQTIWGDRQRSAPPAAPAETGLQLRELLATMLARNYP